MSQKTTLLDLSPREATAAREIALRYGNRPDALLEILHDLQGPERARVRPEDLLRRFDDVRRREQLDPAVAELLQQRYV